MNDLEAIKTQGAPSAAPFVVLFGPHRTAPADNGLARREDRQDVRGSADLPIEPLLGIVSDGYPYSQQPPLDDWTLQGAVKGVM